MGVIPNPSITEHRIDPATDFAFILATGNTVQLLHFHLILSADGITDFASNESIAHIVSTSNTPKDAIEAVTEFALETNGSKDNVSALIVALPAWGKVRLPQPHDHIAAF
jgi:hypothetical protein